MKQNYSPLPQSFYQRHPQDVALDLLGCLLVRRVGKKYLIGKIVETEAYLSTSDDPASHGFKAESPRTKSLYGPAGYAYVTNVHKYSIMNVVTEGVGQPSAALIRAVEPIEGIDIMKEHRPHTSLINLTNGPGKLTIAFNISRPLDGSNLTQSSNEIFIIKGTESSPTTGISKRIGISQAQELPLRFYLKNNPWVSGPKKNNL